MSQADAIANAAIAHVIKNQFRPVAVSVIDKNGIPIVQKRMDGVSTVGIPEFALAKANSAIAMKMSSREFRDKYVAEQDPAKYCQMLAMVNISEKQLMPCPGGVLIKSENGEILGAIGVSGAAADEDEASGLEGVKKFEELMKPQP